MQRKCYGKTIRVTIEISYDGILRVYQPFSYDLFLIFLYVIDFKRDSNNKEINAYRKALLSGMYESIRQGKYHFDQRDGILAYVASYKIIHKLFDFDTNQSFNYLLFLKLNENDFGGKLIIK